MLWGGQKGEWKVQTAYMAGFARSWNPPITRKFETDVQYLGGKDNTPVLVTERKLALCSFKCIPRQI